MNQQKTSTSNSDALFELYKLYVEMANSVSQRRESSNKFFLTLVTTPVALLVLVSKENHSLLSNPSIMMACSIMGLVISITWILNLVMYRKLNSAKFKVILDIETHLPHAGFTEEKEHLKVDNYRGLTKTEMVLPFLTAACYFSLFLYVGL